MIGPRIAVIGGDERSKLLAERMAWEGFDVGVTACKTRQVKSYAPEIALMCDVLILPVPVTRDGVTLNTAPGEERILLATLFHGLCPGTWILGGALSDDFRRRATAMACRATDYFDTDAVARENAVPTAEGALALAMEHSDITVSGSSCLVIGSGRCGRALARLLRGVGAKVTVTSRRARHRLWARLHGLRPARTDRLADIINGYDFIFNTVPARVVDATVLKRMRRKAVLIELATAAAGVDVEAAEKLEKTVLVAPGLPGKVAPATAAGILYRSVIGILTEEYPWIDCE